MGTSTGDVAHGLEQNTERPESGPGELIVTAENETNEGAETTINALQNGKFIYTENSDWIIFLIDEAAEEREEEPTNADEDAGGEQ